MKTKQLTAFAVTFLLLFSSLLLTQCTEKEPETQEEIMKEIETNCRLEQTDESSETYRRTLGEFLLPAFYSVPKDGGDIQSYGEAITSGEIRKMEQLLEKNPGIQGKWPQIPETLENGSGETCHFAFISSVKLFFDKDNGNWVPFKEVNSVYENEAGVLFPQTTTLNLLDNSVVADPLSNYR